jgi:hypothetical protein
MGTCAQFERLDLRCDCPYASSSKKQPFRESNVTRLDTPNALAPINNRNRAVELVERFN